MTLSQDETFLKDYGLKPGDMLIATDAFRPLIDANLHIYEVRKNESFIVLGISEIVQARIKCYSLTGNIFFHTNIFLKHLKIENNRFVKFL